MPKIQLKHKKVLNNQSTMGQKISMPVPAVTDTADLVCFALRRVNKVRLLQAPQDVVDMTARVVG